MVGLLTFGTFRLGIGRDVLVASPSNLGDMLIYYSLRDLPLVMLAGQILLSIAKCDTLLVDLFRLNYLSYT